MRNFLDHETLLKAYNVGPTLCILSIVWVLQCKSYTEVDRYISLRIHTVSFKDDVKALMA